MCSAELSPGTPERDSCVRAVRSCFCADRGDQKGHTTGWILQELADWNAQYEAKFGHIFIICASGKSAKEMLDAVKSR